MLRGEIWLVRLDPTIGTEISKTRPAIIVNDDLERLVAQTGQQQFERID